MKKKLLAIVVVLTMLFALSASACGSSETRISVDPIVITNNSDAGDEGQTIVVPDTDEESDKEAEFLEFLQQMGWGNNNDTAILTTTEETTFLGYGINVIDSTSLESKKIQVFDDTVYTSSEDGVNKYIDSSTLEKSETTSSTGSSLSEMHSSLNVGASVSTGKAVPFFSGNLEAQYGKSKSVATNTIYYKSIISLTKKQQTLKGKYAAPLDARVLINETVLKNLDGDMPAMEIFQNYGTHIITAANTGGSADVTAVYSSYMELDESEVSAALNFSSSWFGASAKTSLTDSEKTVNMDTKITVTTLGGDSSLVVGASDILEVGKAIREWGKTINDNVSLAKIIEARPIWEFVTDVNRSSELKTAFENYAATRTTELNNYFSKSSTPIIRNNGIYSFRSCELTTMVMDLNGLDKKASQNYVNLWEYLDIPSQKWRLINCPYDKDYYYIQNCESGIYLDLCYDTKDQEGIQLWQYQANATDSQRFKLLMHEDGRISIIPKLASQFALAAKGGNGEPVKTKLYDKNESMERWMLVSHNE